MFAHTTGSQGPASVHFTQIKLAYCWHVIIGKQERSPPVLNSLRVGLGANIVPAPVAPSPVPPPLRHCCLEYHVPLNTLIQSTKTRLGIPSTGAPHFIHHNGYWRTLAIDGALKRGQSTDLKVVYLTALASFSVH